jgi:nucleotide-binding universal stress UspA family protein
MRGLNSGGRPREWESEPLKHEGPGPITSRSFLFPLFTVVWKVNSANYFAPNTSGWHHAPTGQASSERTLYMSIFPTKVLLATDGSEEAELAARIAADLAQKTSSELHMIYVFGIGPVGPPVYPEAPDLQGEALEEEAEERISEQRAREVLEVEVGKVRSAGGTVVEAHLIEGRIAPQIVALAEQIGAGLIVMGARGVGGIRRALTGSVSDSVVRHAHCPVLVVRE